MYEKINNDKSKNTKLLTTPKLKQNIFRNNKSKVDLREKVNNLIKKQEKNSLANTDINSNMTLLENKSNLENMNFYNSFHNNIFRIEKAHQKNDIYARKKVKRKIIPLNLTDKFNNQNFIILTSHTKKSNLNFSLVHYMNNKPLSNKNNKHIDENLNLEKNEAQNNIYKKVNYYKYLKIKEKNIKIEKQKSINLDWKEYNQYSNNTINNDKNLIKHRSYDLLIKVSLNKNDRINENINPNKENNNININNNDVCHYIKVNKKVINHNDNINKININKNKDKNNVQKNINKNANDNIIKLKTKNIQKNKIIKDKTEISKINTLCRNSKIYNNSELTDKYNKASRTIFTKVEKINRYNNNFTNNKKAQIKNKNLTLDKNKLENNIFLDKAYQNRFNKSKNNSKKPLNDIFTNDKQKEYNTFIIKKKNNYLTNMIMNSNNNNNRNSNIDSKDWVYRLYNKEIKKQKIKDKIILLLRKSILNDEDKDNTKKKLEKSKTEKQFKNYKYPVNEGYNFDDNFNIINLFLSDDKKKAKKNISKKNKKMKKCKSSHSHRNKQRKYSFDNIMEEDEKINKLIDDKIYLKNHRSYKKLRYMYYNEELINEEDEEKEQEKDEDNDEKSV